jgi:hypothetical protein
MIKDAANSLTNALTLKRRASAKIASDLNCALKVVQQGSSRNSNRSISENQRNKQTEQRSVN